MRPLLAPQTLEPVEGEANALTAVLLDHFGPYCSICERPLFERAFPWDADTGHSVPYNDDRPNPRCLVLCATCEQAQGSRDDAAFALSLPFDESTFGLASEDRQFNYRDGGVQPASPRAERTLDYFDLLDPRPGDPGPRFAVGPGTWPSLESSVLVPSGALRSPI